MREEHISAEQVPRHVGGDQGIMQGRVVDISEATEQSGAGNQGNRGTGVYGESELPGTNDIHGTGEFGSATVVTLGELDAVEPELDPAVPPKHRTAQQILAEMQNRLR